MRMWMVNPKIMCRKHLLGEHVELHMFIGTMKKKKSLNGYANNNLVEPLLIKQRHDELVVEMKRRGYKHKTEIDEDELNKLLLNYKDIINIATVNRSDSLQDLLSRCTLCSNQHNNLQGV